MILSRNPMTFFWSYQKLSPNIRRILLLIFSSDRPVFLILTLRSWCWSLFHWENRSNQKNTYLPFHYYKYLLVTPVCFIYVLFWCMWYIRKPSSSAINPVTHLFKNNSNMIEILFSPLLEHYNFHLISIKCVSFNNNDITIINNHQYMGLTFSQLSQSLLPF